LSKLGVTQEMRLYSTAEINQLRHELPYLAQISDWLRDFLAKPHSDLGRPGPVCPFLPKALELNSIRLTEIRADGLNLTQLKDIVRDYRDIFLELEPQHGDLAYFKAIMLVFPDISADDALVLIDGVQRELKPFFVEMGLMLGEFHERSESPGLHNPDFRPLRSPVPMLAIRFMAESDLPFLQRSTDEPHLRIRYLEAYLNRMTSVIRDEKKLQKAKEALAIAYSEQHFDPHEAPQQKVSKCPFARLARVFS